MKIIKRFLKEIIIALILAVIAAVLIEKYSESSKRNRITENSKAIATVVPLDKDRKPIGQGSGIFITPNGALVTNYHVIKDATSVLAKLSSGAFYERKGMIGIDKYTDIAIIQFDAKETPFTKKIGNSDRIRVGDKVFTIGSPLALESTVSEGIISNPNREFDGRRLIQFTAPISSGSSGGGLFDDKGEVIGITTGALAIPKEFKEETISQNLNFAVPINDITHALEGKEKRFTEGSPDYFYSLGVLAENKEEYDKAIQYFNKTLELDDKYTDAYLDLGTLYSEKRLYDKELEVFEKAIQLAPNDFDANYYLALAYEDKELYDKAIIAYTKALELKPNDADALYNTGILYIIMGQKDKALEMANRVIPLNSGLGRELKLLIEKTK
jgi:TPR repeat protein